MSNHRDCNFRINLGVLLVLIACSVTTFAQIEVVPFKINSEPATPPINTQRVMATLNLPFFDDFSTTPTHTPDTTFWMPNSGVYINNTLTKAQPSINVATFDGLNGEGYPYNFSNSLFQNFTDTLTSRPVNLGLKTISDSVYLSFYWQSGVLIEKPDSSDYIQVEFLAADQKWEVVWKQNGYLTDSAFHRVFLRLDQSKWFHNNFQFRFRSYGRSSGAYDMWHIDYVYLNQNRTSKDIYIRDLAVTQPLTPLLKEYTAMPLQHYKVDPSRFTSTALMARVANQYNNENRTSFELTIMDDYSGTSYPGGREGSTFIGSLATLQKSVNLKAFVFGNTLDSARLRTKFHMLTSDNQNPSIPTIDLTRNDTISSVTHFTDFYAYDDGTAEYGVQINQKLGRVAIQYVVTKPDTIGGVRMSVIPFNKDISGQSFTLQVWNNKNGKPDQIIAQNAFASRYVADRTKLIEFRLTKPVVVTDTFYVGWLQVNEQPLTVGYDLNSEYGSHKAFYNLGNEWVNSTDLRGSVMIRPFIAKQGVGIVTGAEKVEERLLFYPNPTSGIIRWQVGNIELLEVANSSGQLVKRIKINKGQQYCDLRELSAGIYFLRSYIKGEWYSQKIFKID